MIHRLLIMFAAVVCVSVRALAQHAPGDRGGDVNVTFPPTLLSQNGGQVIDIKNPPDKAMHAAVGDGIADDTAAFVDAYDVLRKNYEKDGWGMRNMFIYIPDGTYKISDTIIYRGEAIKLNGHDDLCHIKFIGQSRGKTILRLVDHAPGFGDKTHPRPLLAFQHPDTKFNNAPGGNDLRNLTINVGSGNPGAAAVMFQAANQSDIRNVTLTSDDGGGLYGIWFRMGSVQGYYTDITINGFDYGIYDSVNPESDPAFENLTLTKQKVAGIHLSGGGMSLASVHSTQTGPEVKALQIDGKGVQAVMINSDLDGAATNEPAIDLSSDQHQCLFARNVSTKGYAQAIRRAGQVVVSDAVVDEYVTSPPVTLSPDAKARSLALPIESTPQVPWFDPAKDWAVVEDYPNAQAAMNSGKPVVCFKNPRYALGGDVNVPASVKFINLMGADLTGGTLVITEPSSDPVLIQDGASKLRVAAGRNVIERCMGGGISNPLGIEVTFYLENVNDCTTGDNFCRAGQKVYARQIDVEYKNVPQIVVNGGTMWIFGFKTEDSGATAPLVVKNGGTLEVLGGYVNMLSKQAPPDKQPPIITNLDSSVSVTCFTNMTGLYTTAVKETRNGETMSAASHDLPLRGGGYTRNFVIPLYAGYRGK